MIETFIIRSRRLPKRVLETLEVTSFIFYMNILDSPNGKYMLRVENLGRYIGRFLDRVRSKLKHTQSASKEVDQTTGFSTIPQMSQIPVQVGSSEKAREASKSMEDPSMSKLPIVFVHRSNSEYLQYSLNQAKHSNPESTIFLIGDDSNDCYDCVEHHSISHYFRRAGEFSKVYRHFNSSGFQTELFNFQRWFILEEFMIGNNLEKCLYLDSDSLLYANATEEQKKFTKYDMTISFMCSGNVFFLNRVEALTDLCQFMMDIYTKKEKLYYDRMVAHYATFRKNGMRGGVHDNNAFDYYRHEHFGVIGEASLILDESVFDTSIDLPHPGLEMENGVKKVIWKDGEPYGIQLRTGKAIRFLSLHFHGRTKSLMSRYYQGK